MLIGKLKQFFILHNLCGKSTRNDRTNFLHNQWQVFATSEQNASREVGNLLKRLSQRTTPLKINYSQENPNNIFPLIPFNFYGKVFVERSDTGSRTNIIYKINLLENNDIRIVSSRYASTYDMGNISNRINIQTNCTTTNLNRDRINVSEINLPTNYNFLLNQIDNKIDFGVEIEFQSKIDGYKVCNFLRSKNLKVIDKHLHYRGSETGRWVLLYDCSVKEGSWYGYELTTPILIGKKGVKEYFAYISALTELESQGKIRIRKKCGLHIHLGNFANGNRDIAIAVRDHYSKNEKIFDSLVVKSRRDRNNSQYCDQIKRHNENQKYQKLTLGKFATNGTFEIRHHGGSLSFLKTIGWVILNQKITRKITEGYVPIKKRTLLSFLNEFISGCEELIEFFLTRKAMLDPNIDLAVESA